MIRLIVILSTVSQLSEIVRAPPEGGQAGSNNTDCASEIIVFFLYKIIIGDNFVI